MIVSFLFIFFTSWWVIIFAILPWGVERNPKPKKGHDYGAPKDPNIRKKFIITTFVALLIAGTASALLDVYQDELLNYFNEE